MRFGARLAAELADEPGNRFQGMPSDGDSVAGYATMGRERWIGLHWPERLGGRRARSARHGGRRGALRVPLAAAVGLPAVGQDDRQRPARARLRGAPGAASSRDSGRQAGVLPGLLRARGRLRPRVAPHLGAPRRRALRGLGAQDLDLQRPDRRLDLPGGANGPGRGSPAPRRLRAGGGHAHAGHRGTGDPHGRRRRALRGLPHRGGGAREPAGGRAPRRLAGPHGHARPRARDEREGGRGAARARRPRRGGALGRRAPRAPPPARRGPGRAAARTQGRGAARGRPPGCGGVFDGQALDRAARASHRGAGRAAARPRGARGARRRRARRRAGRRHSPGRAPAAPWPAARRRSSAG